MCVIMALLCQNSKNDIVIVNDEVFNFYSLIIGPIAIDAVKALHRIIGTERVENV